MQFAGLSYVAIFIAAAAAFLFGAIYYGVLRKSWMEAARIDPKQAKMRPSLFVTSFICELIMAWVLGGVLGHLGPGQVTVMNGMISGLFVWAGFIATTIAVNQRYQGFGWKLTFIDAGHWLGVVILMGAIIGWMGV
jgi:F0F1-type ATP synthase membrane subunit c/vacuolar-type H+-ATPase subunit K